MGLAISRHFCQMMGGNIGVESQGGTKSAFTVNLPVGHCRVVEGAAEGSIRHEYIQ